MCTIDLEFERITDLDFISDTESVDKTVDAKNSNFIECGGVLIDFGTDTVCFCCVFCKETFQDISKLITHFQELHTLNTNTNDPENQIPNDEKSINTEYEPPCYTDRLQVDMEDKTIEKAIEHFPFSCNLCPKYFLTNEKLTYHLAIHKSLDGKFKCDHCNQIFTKKRYLQTHLNYHFVEKLHTCKVCGKVSRTRQQLEIHMVKHTLIKDYICEICGASYRLRHHLVLHQKQIHENKREFKCNLCERTFNTVAFLNKHMIAHKKERKHICDTCGSGFKWRKNLVEHLKLHLDTKNYTCEWCPKTFAQKSGLINHTKYHKNLNRTE